MTDKTETVVARGSAYRWIVFEVTLSTNETVTIDDLSTVQDAALFALDDGLKDTATVSGNVITLTQAGVTNKKYVGIAVGA